MKTRWLVPLALFASACAAQSAPPSPTSAAAAPMSPSPKGYPPAPPPPPPASTEAPAPADGDASKDKGGTAKKNTFAQPPADTMDERAPDFQTAQTRFFEWAKALESSLGSSACDMACRALASMDRSAKVMCELAHGADEQVRCNDAKARLREARGRVKRTCGECAGGPTTDPNAP
jgi:hypothetical protein